jgi:hypothetical protein
LRAWLPEAVTVLRLCLTAAVWSHKNTNLCLPSRDVLGISRPQFTLFVVDWLTRIEQDLDARVLGELDFVSAGNPAEIDGFRHCVDGEGMEQCSVR